MKPKININIQMLRGLSVLMVLLFHLDISYFKFGYIGVDIFFLLSGFLMPEILPKYSAFQFINARIKRLFPALSIVIFFTLLVGYLLLLPGEYLNLSFSATSAFSFLSQFYFIFNTGYFDLNAKYQPLLHTWSLGNEFLAYIIIFISLLFLPRKYLVHTSVVLVLISFIYIINCLYTDSIDYLDPIPRFFLFFIAFYISSKKNKLNVSDEIYISISLLSFFIILLIFGDDLFNKVWPNSSIFILPFFIIPLMLMKYSFLPIKTVSNILCRIGDWSYSIYIWHWVLICYERVYFRNINLNLKEATLLFFLSIAVGYISYRFLEKRKSIGFGAFLLSIVLCTYIYSTNGAAYRIPSGLNKYSSIEKMIDNKNYLSSESIDKFNLYTIVKPLSALNNSILIVGDSHSRHFLPIIKSGQNEGLYRLSAQPELLVHNWDEFRKLTKNIPVSHIIFAFRLHTKSLDSIKSLTSNLKLLGVNNDISFTFIRDIPSLDSDPVACLFSKESNLLYRGCGFDIKNGIPLNKVHNSNDVNWKYLAKNIKGVARLIDTHSSLCDGKVCRTMINNEFIMRDDNHFNENLDANTNFMLYELIFNNVEI